MTGRRWVLGLLLSTVGAPLWGGELDDALQASWRGKWVVLRTEAYADCMDCVTVNNIGSGGVSSFGVRRLDPGELGQVRDVEVKRQRVDVLVDLAEPLLVSSPRAGFVLYHERECALQLRIAVPREAVKQRQVADLDERLAAVLERSTTLAEARGSASWNGRVRQSAPDDHRSTLDAYLAWRAGWGERVTAATVEVASEVIRGHRSDSYLEGFAEGVEEVNPEPSTRPGGVEISHPESGQWSFSVEEEVYRAGWGSCEDLADLPLPQLPVMSGEVGMSDSEEQLRGNLDGRAFAYALRLLGKLKECEQAEPQEGAP